MKRIAIILLALSLTCCGGRWRCRCADSIEHKVEKLDSIYYKPMEVDVPIPRESAQAAVAATDTARVQTSLAEAEAWLENGRIRQTIRNRSDQLQRIRIDMPVHVHSSKEYISGVVTREVEKPLGWFRKILIGAGAITMAAAVLAAIIFLTGRLDAIKKIFKH